MSRSVSSASRKSPALKKSSKRGEPYVSPDNKNVIIYGDTPFSEKSLPASLKDRLSEGDKFSQGHNIKDVIETLNIKEVIETQGRDIKDTIENMMSVENTYKLFDPEISFIEILRNTGVKRIGGGINERNIVIELPLELLYSLACTITRIPFHLRSKYEDPKNPLNVLGDDDSRRPRRLITINERMIWIEGPSTKDTAEMENCYLTKQSNSEYMVS